MRLALGSIGLLLLLLAFPSITDAASPSLTYRYRHHIITVGSKETGRWSEPRETWTYFGREITPPRELRVDGDSPPPLPEGMVRGKQTGWNPDRIRESLARLVIAPLAREPGTITIRRDAEGAVAFEGVGFPGRSMDLPSLVELTLTALKTGVGDITIPLEETPPTVTVEDGELAASGIRELVAFGESDFSGSPVNRRHNIAVGLARFNGHIIPQGETFSFVDVLGPVNGATGYRRELVIKGDRTEPDYGGGLCQVSTTAYRGVWEAGFPIVERKNHSYAVRYYGPQGTDATTYTPKPDMKFANNSPGALVLQTHMEDDKAYFLYYGTKDARQAQVIGPYIWGKTGAPPPRTEYTTALPPGTTKVLGHAVPGMQAAWYRITRTATGAELVEEYKSSYQARPDFFQVGVEGLPPSDMAPATVEPGAEIPPPNVIPR